MHWNSPWHLFLLHMESSYRPSQWWVPALFKVSLESNYSSPSLASIFSEATKGSNADGDTFLNSFPAFVLAPHQNWFVTKKPEWSFWKLIRIYHLSAQNLPMAAIPIRVKCESYRGYLVTSPPPLTSPTSFSLFVFNSTHTVTLSFFHTPGTPSPKAFSLSVPSIWNAPANVHVVHPSPPSCPCSTDTFSPRSSLMTTVF